MQENSVVVFCAYCRSWSSHIIFMNHQQANSYSTKIIHDQSHRSSRRQSGLSRGLCKCWYLSNASTICDGIFTIYSQDSIDYDHFWIIFKSHSNKEKSASKSQYLFYWTTLYIGQSMLLTSWPLKVQTTVGLGLPNGLHLIFTSEPSAISYCAFGLARISAGIAVTMVPKKKK